ncbi:MAG: hypothetical protein MR471_07540 [Clostridia bacterium]|nr:hypothetical protein [Clostridia bacterium]MDY3785287.1 hypothetical protein [Eubacteriales bacterium]
MKKFSKLIPAFCMLLISAMLMGTSTFAWFSMNTKVTASSMTVKATASKNLLISGTETGTYLPSLALTTNKTTLVPVSTAVLATPKFFKLDNVGSEMTADSHDRKNSTLMPATDADYLKETMWVKTTGTDATDLRARITFTGGTAALDPALRVMFVVGGMNAYLMTPVANASSAYRAIADVTYEAASGTAVAGTFYFSDANGTKPGTQPNAGDDVSHMFVQKVTETATNVTISPDNAVILSSLNADQAVQIDVYIWYEGQDVNCKSTNAVTLDNTVFTVEYTVE